MVEACYAALKQYPYNLYGLLICIAILVILIVFVMRLGYDRNGGIADKERNLTYSNKGTYGTSGFMDVQEMLQVLNLVGNIKNTKGIILGRLGSKAICLPEDTRMNRNVAVYGASGSMKSRAYVRNAVFQSVSRSESLILTDPKSELYEDMAIYLEENGYTVKIFNLFLRRIQIVGIACVKLKVKKLWRRFLQM